MAATPGQCSALSHLDCSAGDRRYDAAQVCATCECGAPLLARYDTERVAALVNRSDIAARPADLWRYHELLPVGDAGHVVSLGEGMTPLLALPRLGSKLGVPGLLMRDEGKKTMGLEIAEQLGWRLPDVIVYPTGGGVGIIGIYKALLELRELGWVDGELPRLVAVQAAGCAPIVKALHAGADESEPWPDPKTVAFGLTVPKALGDFLVLDALRATGGTAIAAQDTERLADQRTAASVEGCVVFPEGAACST